VLTAAVRILRPSAHAVDEVLQKGLERARQGAAIVTTITNTTIVIIIAIIIITTTTTTTIIIIIITITIIKLRRTPNTA
jgi:hypothetical protein